MPHRNDNKPRPPVSSDPPAGFDPFACVTWKWMLTVMFVGTSVVALLAAFTTWSPGVKAVVVFGGVEFVTLLRVYRCARKESPEDVGAAHVNRKPADRSDDPAASAQQNRRDQYTSGAPATAGGNPSRGRVRGHMREHLSALRPPRPNASREETLEWVRRLEIVTGIALLTLGSADVGWRMVALDPDRQWRIRAVAMARS